MADPVKPMTASPISPYPVSLEATYIFFGLLKNNKNKEQKKNKKKKKVAPHKIDFCLYFRMNCINGNFAF